MTLVTFHQFLWSYTTTHLKLSQFLNEKYFYFYFQVTEEQHFQHIIIYNFYDIWISTVVSKWYTHIILLFMFYQQKLSKHAKFIMHHYSKWCNENVVVYIFTIKFIVLNINNFKLGYWMLWREHFYINLSKTRLFSPKTLLYVFLHTDYDITTDFFQQYSSCQKQNFEWFFLP